MKRLLSRIFHRRLPMVELTAVQQVFSQSCVNGNDNGQDLLPVNGWRWPRHTWLERRRKRVRRA
jgi:hypothetical protein